MNGNNELVGIQTQRVVLLLPDDDFEHIKNQYMNFWKVSGGEKVFKTKRNQHAALIREKQFNRGRTPCPGEELKVGDIALFNRSACFIAHRIIGKVEKTIPCIYRKRGQRLYQ